MKRTEEVIGILSKRILDEFEKTFPELRNPGRQLQTRSFAKLLATLFAIAKDINPPEPLVITKEMIDEEIKRLGL